MVKEMFLGFWNFLGLPTCAPPVTSEDGVETERLLASQVEYMFYSALYGV